MSAPSRPDARTPRVSSATGAEKRALPSATPGVLSLEGVAGLNARELSTMIHDSPAGDPSVPGGDPAASGALAPYLAGSGQLSAEAYNEWLARVCEQPDDD